MGSLINFRPRRKVLLTAVILVAAAGIVLYARSQLDSSLTDKTGIDMRKPQAAAVLAGKVWQADGVNGGGFAEAARNAGYALEFQQSTGQIRVKNLQSGQEWSSNPSPSALAKETVAGDLRTNLQSPFILEYYEQASIQRKVANALGSGTKWTVTKQKDGIAVQYDLAQLQIKFSLIYTLTENGLQVAIPDSEFEESGNNRIVSIEVLPFFGAAGTDETGYLFVPDGPGALMHFPRSRQLIGKGYNQPVYGPEITTKSSNFDSTAVYPSLPVFGMKKGEEAFLAVIKAGATKAAIRALPSGVASSFNSINAKFVYREEYDRRLSLGGKATRVFEEERTPLDGEIEYSFLTGKEADYVGMAKRYREELTSEGKLQPLQKADGHVPFELMIICGNSNRYNNDYEAATTFVQAEEIMKDLKQSGVEHARITLDGWQSHGRLHNTDPFDVEKKLGGKAGLRALVNKAHELGYEIVLNVDFVEADSETDDLSPKNFGVRSAEGDVLLFDSDFILTPNVTYHLAKKLVHEAKAVGVDGVLYEELGSFVTRDYNPNYKYTRDDTALIYNSILDMTRKELGFGGVYLGNSYSFGHIDHINGIPGDTNHFYMVDEMVPFMPIALHGSISYTMAPGNLRNSTEAERLKGIEYGAVPTFMLTAESSRTLLDTTTYGIFSSRYEQWKKQALGEYADMKRMASFDNQPITDHYESEAGVYVTEYGNGVRVTVDYNNGRFDVEGEVSR
ncbi:DUF5696 domain-containing protein [Paenibacillus glycanilyticus]|uniref:DUF5696 domain-containing protein n=1 Tax=Paenibacillus glycanilyticus TaxID=126569 RepID=UPI00203BEFC0|nr:DUF5696 domain-containing protein [Paenibacillus glycanilyticus]MCM3627030.1 DUF5696 domain-containing protein [Paenibacillus glycanilyticus]